MHEPERELVYVEVPVGVIRYVLDFANEPQITGNLEMSSPEMDMVLRGEALALPVTAYCLSERRLRMLLLHAQGGEDVDALMMSVEALALEPHKCAIHHDEDLPYPDEYGE